MTSALECPCGQAGELSAKTRAAVIRALVDQAPRLPTPSVAGYARSSPPTGCPQRTCLRWPSGTGSPKGGQREPAATGRGKLTTMTYACIMTDVTDYAKVMIGLAKEEIGKHPDDPAYGYLLQTESFRVIKPGPEASAAEREQYDRDLRERTFRKRADAVEVCSAWVADIHGRLWFAEKERDNPGHVREVFYRPGATLPSFGGPVIDALLAVAEATGILCHGLPGPD